MVETSTGGELTICVYACGCSSLAKVPTELDAMAMKVSIVAARTPETAEFEMQFGRTCREPSIFIEVGIRPEWAKECHQMVHFDTRINGTNWKNFEAMLEPYVKRYGRLVPSCWLPDIMAGRGRFFNFWVGSVDNLGRRVGHLYVVEDDAEVEADVVLQYIVEEQVVEGTEDKVTEDKVTEADVDEVRALLVTRKQDEAP